MQDIRSLRLSHKIRQQDLATALDIPLQELRKFERRLATPPFAVLEKVGMYFREDVSSLVQVYSSQSDKTLSGEGYSTAISQTEFCIDRKKAPDKSRIPIIDLFCGTGGFSHGFELTGAFQVTAGIDLLADRVQTFSENHHAAVTFCADIQKFNMNALFDVAQNPMVVIGGPPCQGFSSLRPFRALNERDSRNTLFEEFALSIHSLRPEWFILENVVGLLTHQKGQTFRVMLDLFQQIGYSVSWKVLNAAVYGLPQRRERLIIVGNSKGKKFVWPEPTHFLNDSFRSMAGKKYENYSDLPLFRQDLQPAISVMQAIHDLPEVAAGEKVTQYRDTIALTEYERLLRGHEIKLTLHEATAHSPHMLEIIRQSGSNRYELPKGLTTSGFSSSYSRLEPDSPSVTLTVNFVHPSSNKCIHPYQNRALTPREGARLQGFEDGYRFSGTRSQVVKQIGNAVPPLLGQRIAESLLAQI